MTIYSWNEINIHTITNLYLYGANATPGNYEDRMRPGSSSGQTIEIDMAGFMSTGPGRFANPSMSFGVSFFLSGGLSALISDGEYSKKDLENYGLQEDAFNVVELERFV